MQEPSEPINILVVDDNPAIHDDLRKILLVNDQKSQDLEVIKNQMFESKSSQYVPKIKYEIDSAVNGAQAVAMMEKCYSQAGHKRYSLVFMDIVMPIGWDGVETTRRLWKVDPDLQVVICSAYSEYSWESIVEKLGYNDNFLILKKPFEKIEIAQMVCCLTQKWLLSQQAGHKYDRLHQEVMQISKDIIQKYGDKN